MTAAFQLDLLAAPPDPTRDAILQLIAGDRIHQHDRAVIVDTIVASVRPDGTVSANDYRLALAGRVYPACIGATVHALRKAGVLIPTDVWEMSTDTASRNGNKPVRRFRWNATGTEARP